MPTDKLDSGNKSNVKTNRVLVASNIILGISVLSFIFMLGGCVACIGGSETTYDSRETYYRKPDGSVGYGAKSHRDTSKDAALVFLGGFGVCFVTFIVGFFVRGFADEEQLDEI